MGGWDMSRAVQGGGLGWGDVIGDEGEGREGGRRALCGLWMKNEDKKVTEGDEQVGREGVGVGEVGAGSWGWGLGLGGGMGVRFGVVATSRMGGWGQGDGIEGFGEW